jgi:hypothetical protein
MSEANTVAAILIDPDQRTIARIRLRVVPPEEGASEECVNKIPLEELYARLDCREFGAFAMPGCEADSVFYNDEMLEADGRQVAFFQLGEGWEPIAGRCLVVGFDMMTHEYRDAVTTVEQLELRSSGRAGSCATIRSREPRTASASTVSRRSSTRSKRRAPLFPEP